MSAPERIRALDLTLANQIAAGEVVERPASVLKELLENAIDAGATRIDVHAERGGIASLRISDDGCGIHRDDLRLALQRHATSKIATLEQLESVLSMGFRGEALPSIASVSRLQIMTRVHGDDSAWQIRAEGGPADEQPVPVSHPAGTTVAMHDLFFNTPVRRRFLRAPRTELRHLERVFRRIALGAFPVAMSLTHDGKELVRVASAHDAPARRRRVARLVGERFAAAALPVDRNATGMRVWGWVAPPDLARERHDQQHLYVNGRAVVDSTVRHAVRLAYGDAIADTRHPCWLLWLEIDPQEVDVNVHPAKLEVRFREAGMVHDFMRASVRDALRGCAQSEARRTADGSDSDAVPLPKYEHSSEHAVTSTRRTSARSHPNRATPATEPAMSVLAVLTDGLLVARRGEQLLLAQCSALMQTLVHRNLSAVERGDRAPVSRPLLLPQRVTLSDLSSDAEAALCALESLGFSVRASGEHSVLVLAVPECLSRLGVERWQSVFADAARRARAADWIEPLASAGAEQALANNADAGAVLAQLAELDDDAAPWIVLDAQRAVSLLNARSVVV